MQKSSRNLTVLSSALAIALGGCSSWRESDVNEFREAIPAQGSVSVDGPDSTTSADMRTASGSRGTLGAGDTERSEPAY